MSDRVGFQYVVLRVVPRVDREEFLNVGVVLYCQDRDYLACAARLDESRAEALHPGLDLVAIRSGLDGVAGGCAGRTDPTAEMSLGQRFGWLAAPRSTVLQHGPIHGGVTDDPDAELAHLLDRYTG